MVNLVAFGYKDRSKHSEDPSGNRISRNKASFDKILEGKMLQLMVVIV